MNRHVSALDAAPLEALAAAIARNGDALVLVRHVRAKEWHLVTSASEVRDLIAAGSNGTSYLAFLDPQLPLRGEVDGDFAGALRELADGHPELLVGVRNGGTRLLAAGAYEPVDDGGRGRLLGWLESHAGEQGVAGPFPPLWTDDDSILEIVVPDEEGRLEHPLY